MAIRRRRGGTDQISIDDALSEKAATQEAKASSVLAQDRRKSKKSERQEFFLPVTGFVWFYPEEVKIINHPAFQRLGKINQLGQTNLVFRGATHKRLEHVLGVVHTTQKMIAAVNFNVQKARIALDQDEKLKPLDEEREDPGISDCEQRFIRLGALLHDIGHVAAGHTLEDELGLLSKHDEDARIDLLLDKRDWYEPEIETAFAGQSLRELIDELYGKYIPDPLRNLEALRAFFPIANDELKGKLATQLTPSNMLKLLIRKPPHDSTSDPIRELEELIRKTPYIRYKVATNMIGNTICADLVDYLYRDWYHLGRSRLIDDRITQYMEIRPKPTPQTTSFEHDPRQRRTKDDEFVINLGRDPKIRTDGVSAILGLLEWRYELAETALFHRTKLSAGAMLDRALYELFEDKSEKDILDIILTLSDDQLLDGAISYARNLQKTRPEAVSVIIGLLSRLKHRRLFRPLVTFFYDDLSGETREYVQKTYGADGSNRKAADNRADAIRKLERDFLLPDGCIAMYCAAIRPKIAQVMIAVNDSVEKFSVYEDENAEEYKNKKKLSGGHLAAQIRRFERLWRVHFLIDRDVDSTLTGDERIKLEEYIKNVILTKSDPDRTSAYSQNYAQAMAARYAERGFLPRQEEVRGNRVPESARPVAARSQASVAAAYEDSEENYHNGARTIRSFFVRKTEEVDKGEGG